MKNDTEFISIVDPSQQPELFGYDSYFNFFIELFNNNKFPSVSLLSGPKGIGKSTFIYHFINYLFSINDEKKYNLKDKKIDSLTLRLEGLEPSIARDFKNFHIQMALMRWEH